jgi:Flp pilus assembly protein CpaB
MRIQTVILLVVAVVCGTAGSRLAKRLFSSPPAVAPAPLEERVKVWAAKQPLSAGTVLREPEKWFEERTLPKSEEPDNAITRFYLLRGRRLARSLEIQAIVTIDDLAADEQDGAALLKKEGRQPFDIVLVLQANTLLPPDARVDVLPGGQTGSASARAAAVHLPLLGIRPVDQETVLATLAVTGAEAQQLRQAAAQGSLRLVLSRKP